MSDELQAKKAKLDGPAADAAPAAAAAAAAAAAPASALSPEETRRAIIKQIEYYFSDRNLAKDKFLLQSLDKEGWVGIDVLLTFNRLKAISSDAAAIAEAMRSVDKNPLVLVSDDGAKLRRDPSRPLQGQSELDKRSVYVKGFPTEGTTIDKITEWFKSLGYVAESVHLRTLPKDNKFKGSIFAQLDSEENAKKFVESQPKYEGEALAAVEMKPAYHDRKKLERKAARSERKAQDADKKRKEKEEAIEAAMDKGCVVKLEGLDAETSREDLKEAYGAIGEVAWVDYSRGETEAFLRFKETGNAAKAVDAKTEVKGATPTVRMLEGQEEKDYWIRLEDEKSDRRNRRGGGGRGRGRGRGGGRGRGRGKRSRD